MSDVFGIFVIFSPLILILFLANWGERLQQQGQPAMAPVAVSYISLILAYGATFLIGLVFLLTAGSAASPIQAASPLWLSLGLLLPSVVGVLLLLKPVRRLVARFIPLDPDHPVHAVALSLTMLPLLALGFTLGIGLDALAAQLTQQTQVTGAEPFSLAALWAQDILFLLTALIGVGWLSRRSLGQTLVRLGLVLPSGRQVLIGVGTALLLVPAVILLESAFNAIGLGVGQDVESLTEVLMGPLFATPFGILSVGLAAAIGEEPIFRGALLPRFGLLLSSVIFALVHSQYGISLATLIVLGLGLVLGILRQRTNTTTAMITHAVYNSSLGVLAYLAAQVVTRQP